MQIRQGQASSSPSDVGRRRECGTGRPEVPRSIDVFVEVSDDGLPVEGGVRVPLVGATLPLPARRDDKIDSSIHFSYSFRYLGTA